MSTPTYPSSPEGAPYAASSPAAPVSAPPTPTAPPTSAAAPSNPSPALLAPPGPSQASPDHVAPYSSNVVEIDPDDLEGVEAPAVLDPTQHATLFRRRKTARQNVNLRDGIVEIEVPVPPRLWESIGESVMPGDEGSKLRYTAATCAPRLFPRKGYTLRPQLLGREIELAICVTLYNEDVRLLTRTISALISEIRNLTSRASSPMWGATDSWTKIVLVVVADGRKSIHPSTLAAMGALGIYQDTLAQSTVADTPVVAHVFENTTQLTLDPTTYAPIPSGVPVQTVFVLKEQNQRKINSHRWFFEGVCEIIRPNVCMLVDVGTRPLAHSLYHFWKAFDRHPHIGGVCGEIMVDTTVVGLLKNPLVAAQNFEYKMANMLDKALESSFGYISVLPGAFSAYRWVALQNTSPGRGPLASYFKGEDIMNGKAKGGVFKNNMYLAEDRILCFELVSKINSRWLLRYVKDAKAATDVPSTVHEMVLQRRRWINGSVFAALYTLINWRDFFKSEHTYYRKIAFMVSVVYQWICFIWQWFEISSFYLTYYFVLRQNSQAGFAFGNVGQWFYQVLNQVYLAAIVLQLVASLGNRPQGNRRLYQFTTILWAVLMWFFVYCIIWVAVRTFQDYSIGISAGSVGFFNLIIALLATYGLYFFASAMFLDIAHCLTSFVQYTLLTPLYINVLLIYAFCNLHDVSWGNRPEVAPPSELPQVVISKDTAVVELPDTSNAAEANEHYGIFLSALSQAASTTEKESAPPPVATREDEYRMYRTNFVLTWIASNVLLILVLTNESILSRFPLNWNPYLSFVFFMTTAFALVKACGVVYYLVEQNWLEKKRDEGELGLTRPPAARQADESREQLNPV
ncbi:glycosyltransferase family 2 protein [Gonapodya prolifera JEL478]|uniref:Chitin synthase n=1 Tax=Gonapodya prolifera (strain JEL478) TaxID=1344416 RepID=A0A139ANT3_GONPJ|nr:glycosyltransferase family 2 protein [Gonapodya prolifera JEL478]|eukprot:KXS18396.1 glycosyltransferase family 2 protein [Gonapodya prolifera JEL478]